MLTSPYHHYEDLRIELHSYMNEMGLSRNRQRGAPRPMSRRLSISDRIAIALIPLLVAFALVV